MSSKTNRHQEALDTLELYSYQRNHLTIRTDKVAEHNAVVKELAATLQELVDLTTPKKPVYVEDGNCHFEYCGNCHQSLYIFDQYKFCNECGHPIDWSQDEQSSDGC